MTGTVVRARAAEDDWLEAFVRGPRELTVPRPVQVGDRAPDAVLVGDDGNEQALSSWWQERPALVMFWRHFGCTCGIERAARLRDWYGEVVDAGGTAVIVGMGGPERAAAYRRAHGVPCRILCDPYEQVYRQYGLVEWQPEQVLYDAPSSFRRRERATGEEFLAERLRQGRPPTDNPWRQTGDFLVTADGRIGLALRHQYCGDFPDPRIVPAYLERSRS